MRRYCSSLKFSLKYCPKFRILEQSVHDSIRSAVLNALLYHIASGDGQDDYILLIGKSI
jgi:hypothetical protein